MHSSLRLPGAALSAPGFFWVCANRGNVRKFAEKPKTSENLASPILKFFLALIRKWRGVGPFACADHKDCDAFFGVSGRHDWRAIQIGSPAFLRVACHEKH
jgi:hypothetical protein